MAERRNVNFWSKQVLGLGRFEPEWFKVMRNDLDFSCGWDMGNHVEKTIGNRLLLSGPLIDSYLEEIAKNISSKLSRSKLTGLVPPITFFHSLGGHEQVCRYFCCLWGRYKKH